MEVNYSKLSDYGITLEIDNGILFYPCCESDIAGPLFLFQDYINTFYFVDFNFTINRMNPSGKIIGDIIEPFILEQESITEIKSAPQTIEYEMSDNRTRFYRDKEPKIYTFIYGNKDNNDLKYELNLYKRFGIFALYYLHKKIDLFFYRNDSLGEGGSGNYWNTHPSITLVLSKLKNGGYIITDGSNSFGSHGDYKFIRILEEDKIDRYGNQFQYIGKFVNRNRMWDDNKVWRIWKNPDLENNERFIRDMGLCKKMFLHL